MNNLSFFSCRALDLSQYGQTSAIRPLLPNRKQVLLAAAGRDRLFYAYYWCFRKKNKPLKEKLNAKLFHVTLGRFSFTFCPIAKTEKVSKSLVVSRVTRTSVPVGRLLLFTVLVTAHNLIYSFLITLYENGKQAQYGKSLYTEERRKKNLMCSNPFLVILY